MAIRLGQLIEQLGGSLHGDPDFLVQKISPLETATSSSLSFLSNPLYRSQLATTEAGCVIVSPEMQSLVRAGSACIVSPNPYLYFAKVTQLWRQQQVAEDGEPLVHPSAVVHPKAVVHPTARIGPLCVIEKGARVGAGSWLKSHVTLGADCSIGEHCILHAGVVIGADGFGFAPIEGRWEKIEQLGAVRIGNKVEIGANSCVDRGALEEPRVRVRNQRRDIFRRLPTRPGRGFGAHRPPVCDQFRGAAITDDSAGRHHPGGRHSTGCEPGRLRVPHRTIARHVQQACRCRPTGCGDEEIGLHFGTVTEFNSGHVSATECAENRLTLTGIDDAGDRHT